MRGVVLLLEQEKLVTVKYYSGDIFTTTAPLIAHGVNTQGVMGAGIAKTIAQMFPKLEQTYVQYCKKGVLKPGMIFPYNVGEDKWIINISSQKFPGADAQMGLLKMGLIKTFLWMEVKNYNHIAFPHIGAGIGGLDWETQVNPLFLELAPENYIVELWSFDR